MRRRCLAPLVIAAVVATAILAPAGTAHAAATPSTCAKASKARGVTRIATSRLAVVFTRDPKPVSIPNATLYGCAYGGRVLRLSKICCEGQKVKLAGTFLFYAYRGSAEGDETDKIGLYDLKKGKRVKFKKLRPNEEGPDPEIETYSTAYSMTVTSTGSVAWIVPLFDANDEFLDDYELRIADRSDRAERIADRGKLDKNSVRLGSDEKTLTYRKDGATKTGAISSPYRKIGARALTKSPPGAAESVRSLA